MTLPASGAISFNAINVELGVAGTTQANINQASYRTLAGIPSGQISLSNFYGKSNTFSFTISANQTNANLRTLAINAGWNQTSNVSATIGSGIYISSNGTGTPALTINGSFPNGVTLTNSGFIVGMGGAGGRGGNAIQSDTVPVVGSAGGLALSVSSAVSINNIGTIGGGGGGGAGGAGSWSRFLTDYNGGGGGGGRSSAAANSAGGAAGVGGSGGGAGGPGTVSAPGAGGAAGGGGSQAGGTGGGWGTAGTTTTVGGGAAGGAVSGNGNITWTAFGTRLGPIA